jgi:hypothetical protein
MNPLIQRNKVTLVFFIALTCFALPPTALAVVPAPDGGYPNKNTAEGTNALFSLTLGHDNTAVGYRALYSDTGTPEIPVAASRNTAIGSLALHSNTLGFANTATGDSALLNNIFGSYNVANGTEALANNRGLDNTATGFQALGSNTGGRDNTATGSQALLGSTGSNNIALGSNAGKNLTTGSNNIDIGNVGVAGESGSIRIGISGTQTKTFIAGIRGSSIAGTSVVVNNFGRLGTVASSQRFKDDIKPMDKASQAILALKPVTFRYKHDIDPDGIPQFGLVAEDVEKVNPDLVIHDADGKVYTVRYEAVNAMLLNEFLKEHRKLEQMQKQIDKLTAGLQKVSAQLELTKTAPQTVVNSH